MKNFIYQIRVNHVYYFITLLCAIIFLIGIIVLTYDYEWGRHTILVGLFIMLYLIYFLGVDPIKKGLGLTLIPFVFGLFFSLIVEQFVPDEIQQEWFVSHNTRGGSIESAFFFTVLIIVSKLSKVQPFIKTLEKKE